MKKLIIVFLCLININSYAKEKLEPTVSGKIVSFSTVTIPERASVRVYCDFDMNKGYAEEFYAYVTPYAGNFNIMAYVTAQLPHNKTFFEEIGSKVYMSQSTWGPDSGKKSITIVGVTQNNEAIIIDLSHTPSTTTVSCNY